MELIGSEILKAAGYLLVACVVFFAWDTARKETIKGGFKKVLFKGFCWCAGIALFASIMMGGQTCEEQSDPLYGGCDRYADDGFDPTVEQRVAKFAYYIILLYVPVVFGVYESKDKYNAKV